MGERSMISGNPLTFDKAFLHINSKVRDKEFDAPPDITTTFSLFKNCFSSTNFSL